MKAFLFISILGKFKFQLFSEIKKNNLNKFIFLAISLCHPSYGSVTSCYVGTNSSYDIATCSSSYTVNSCAYGSYIAANLISVGYLCLRSCSCGANQDGVYVLFAYCCMTNNCNNGTSFARNETCSHAARLNAHPANLAYYLMCLILFCVK